MKKAVMSQDDKVQLLKQMWTTYLRQKDREKDVGREVELEVENMRELFRLAAKGELTNEETRRRYPETEEPLKKGACPKCRGEGIYWSEDVKFTFRNHERRGQGFVVCNCYQGRQRREYIKTMDKKKRKRGP